MNPNKTCGPDGIHGQILKKCCSSLSHPLSILFKISYNTGSVPKDWKLANVVPIHKAVRRMLKTTVLFLSLV